MIEGAALFIVGAIARTMFDRWSKFREGANDAISFNMCQAK
jgi:hypothetical protein